MVARIGTPVNRKEIVMRSTVLTVLAVALVAAVAVPASAEKKKEKKDVPAALNFEVKDIDGKEVELSKYAGDVVLVVNVASQCGYTPQYKDLEALHEKYHEKGLKVLGFPCNQFGKQEPGSEDEIKNFCESKFGVKFDMFSKIDVNGEHRAPLYAYLTSKDVTKDAGDVKWNFEKFLIGRNGKVIARYRSAVKPTDKKVVAAIESALAKK
jgi:glutathione peroxidase